MVSHPLTQFMFCSPGEGAAALVLARGARLRGSSRPPVLLRSVALRTRSFGSFEVFSPSIAIESAPSPTAVAAAAAFEAAGIGPADVDLAQVQDTESGAEVMHLAETGLCQHGEQEKLIASGATEIGGRLPVNTDGGCLANGEPIGASGLRQVHEVVLQLRGEAGRTAGPRPAAGGLHPRVRRTRRERLRRAEPVGEPMNGKGEDRAQATAGPAAALLSTVAGTVTQGRARVAKRAGWRANFSGFPWAPPPWHRPRGTGGSPTRRGPRTPSTGGSGRLTCRSPESMDRLVDEAEKSGKDPDKARFAVTLLTSAVAPTNFWLGNPAAIKRTLETGGVNLTRGVRNWAGDLRHNGGCPR